MSIKLTNGKFVNTLEVDNFAFVRGEDCISIMRRNSDNQTLPPMLQFASIGVDKHDLEMLPELELPLFAWKTIMVGGGTILDWDYYQEFERLRTEMRKLYGVKAELSKHYEDEDERTHICYYPINIAGRSSDTLTLTTDEVVHHVKLESGLAFSSGTRPIKIMVESYYPPHSPATYRKSEWHLSVPAATTLNTTFIADKLAEIQ